MIKKLEVYTMVDTVPLCPCPLETASGIQRATGYHSPALLQKHLSRNKLLCPRSHVVTCVSSLGDTEWGNGPHPHSEELSQSEFPLGLLRPQWHSLSPTLASSSSPVLLFFFLSSSVDPKNTLWQALLTNSVLRIYFSENRQSNRLIFTHLS